MRESARGYARSTLKKEVLRDLERIVLSLDVNGEARQLLVPVHKTLLEVLREGLAGPDFPIAGAAVAVRMDGDMVAGCRIVLSAVASHPL